MLHQIYNSKNAFLIFVSRLGRNETLAPICAFWVLITSTSANIYFIISAKEKNTQLQWNSASVYPQGKWKRYTLNKVRFIQNAISSLAQPVPRANSCDATFSLCFGRSTCSREPWSATKDASPSWMSVILLAFRTVVLPFRTSGTWNLAEELKSKLKDVDDILVIRKRTKEMANKVLLEVNIGT